MSVFAYRLRTARESHNVTQRELAKRCGLSENQINRYENGATEPSVTIISKVAGELSISTDYLLGLTDDPVDRTVLPRELGENEREILDVFQQESWLGLIRLSVEHLSK